MVLILIQGVISSWVMGIIARYLFYLIIRKRTFKNLIGVGNDDKMYLVSQTLVNIGVGFLIGISIALIFRFLIIPNIR